MNSSGTPVTGVASGANDTRAAAASTLEAIVFREVLKPLASGLGPVGDVALESVADSLFARPKT
jgi:hypothetical protein